jgi:hypothetical protein
VSASEPSTHDTRSEMSSLLDRFQSIFDRPSRPDELLRYAAGRQALAAGFPVRAKPRIARLITRP